MRILIYKRTHKGDPDRRGCFGSEDCMGMVRKRQFEAVIGVGGIGSEAKANGIAGKLNWIGSGPRKKFVRGKRGPELTFDNFLDFGTDGKDFRIKAPALAIRMYEKKARHLMVDVSSGEMYCEARKILRMAKHAPPSSGGVARHARICQPRQCPSKRRATC